MAAPKTFETIESIFQIFQSSEEVATNRLYGSGQQAPIVALVSSILNDTENGAAGVAKIHEFLKGLYANNTASDAKEFLNRLINFHSTATPPDPSGDFGGLVGPYQYEDAGQLKTASIYDIISMPSPSTAGENEKHKAFTKSLGIALLRNPLVSPAVKDTGKVETFLNFLPPIVLARCMPLMQIEFVFDRPQSSYETLFPASTLKFLLGGDKIDSNKNGDVGLYKGNNVLIDVDGDKRVYSRAGMDLFTSPQTLVNMNPVGDKARYVEVLDPTRPFATLESVSINITGTTGAINFKTAQVAIKLHDRSRLGELADLFQPGTAGGPGIAKCTVWLTYGLRHAADPVVGGSTAKTYAEFINNNMLVREAYSVRNASFQFDGVGQVSINLQLDMKGGTDILLSTLESGAGSKFKNMIRAKKQLSKDIAKLSQDLHMDSQPKDKSQNSASAEGGRSAEIRGFAIINAAASNTYPDYKPSEVKDIIAKLKTLLKKLGESFGGADNVNQLIKLLEQYYEQKNNKYSFSFNKENQIEEIAKEKFVAISSGPDPFLVTQKKHEKMMEEFFGDADLPHPYMAEVKHYLNNETLAAGISFQGVTKKVVSFGKLFSVFMAPIFQQLEGIDEFQIFFYNINDMAGRASGTNLAEFPIDVPRFLRQYQDYLDANETALMTVQSFVQLVIDSQIENLRAIPYGFRSKQRLFEPWKKGNQGDEMTKEGSAQYPAYAVEVNGGRGTFKPPNVEVLLETVHMRPPVDQTPGDLLTFFEKEQINLTRSSVAGYNKVLKVHIFDIAENPHAGKSKMWRSKDGSMYAWDFEEPFNPYSKVMSAAKSAEPANGAADKVGPEEVAKKASSGQMLTETFTGDLTDRQKIMRMVSRGTPTLIPGMNASAIKEVSFSSEMDAQLQAAQITAVSSGDDIQGTSRGDGIGNLPMRVIPAKLSMRTVGCPLFRFGQMYFVDMNTGTTIDNLYGLHSITHEFAPGKYETALEFSPGEAYAVYESAHEFNLTALGQQIDTATGDTGSRAGLAGRRRARDFADSL